MDFAVVEAGLGGRLDATNVVDPVASLITTISKEHAQYLGGTILEIAGEKAGIIKPGRPLLTSASQARVAALFEKRCRELRSPFLLWGRDFEAREKGTRSHPFPRASACLVQSASRIGGKPSDAKRRFGLGGRGGFDRGRISN